MVRTKRISKLAQLKQAIVRMLIFQGIMAVLAELWLMYSTTSQFKVYALKMFFRGFIGQWAQ